MTPDQKQAQEFATFRAMQNPARNAAMCERLAQPDCGVNFSQDVHAQTISALADCAAMAKAVGWKKSPSSALSLGAAFFCYLQRDAAKPSVRDKARIAAVPVTMKRGKRWSNEGIAK